MMDKMELYEHGYESGAVRFAYIPDVSKAELQVWAKGYADGKERKHKTIDEIEAL